MNVIYTLSIISDFITSTHGAHTGVCRNSFRWVTRRFPLSVFVFLVIYALPRTTKTPRSWMLLRCPGLVWVRAHMNRSFHMHAVSVSTPTAASANRLDWTHGAIHLHPSSSFTLVVVSFQFPCWLVKGSHRIVVLHESWRLSVRTT